MGGKIYTNQSISTVMNEILNEIRDYYDSDYAYYVEKDAEEIRVIYEWCADGWPGKKEQIRMLSPEEYPRWMRQDLVDLNGSDYSISWEMPDGRSCVLAVTGVHRGGCGLELLQTMGPYVSQILEVKKMEKRQEYLSYHDELTGLLNRNSYVEYMAQEEQKNESLQSLGVVSVDVNSLKKFNLEFGYEYGDEVVKRVAELLEDYFKGCQVFRMTGDEYLIFSEEVSYDSFMKQIHSVKKRLDNISLDLVSMGYVWEKAKINVSDLVKSAEEMMRKEKQEYYRREKKEDHSPIIERDLLEDIEKGRYIVCLQPEFDIQTDILSGAEARVRYHHEDMGIIDPKKYLDILEQTKLSGYLDVYVFEQVCKTLQNWMQREVQPVPITVRLSGITLQKEGIVEELMKYVRAYHVPTEYLLIEVAEERDSLNASMMAEVCEQIRRSNIRVILGDFASEESSMSVLQNMEFDALKLDHSIVENIVANRRCQIVAEAVLQISRQLGTLLIASGVVTQDQLNVLKELGYEYAEGVLFNKPITVETFEVRYLDQ